jgi:lipopolysaccharide export system protein LptC
MIRLFPFILTLVIGVACLWLEQISTWVAMYIGNDLKLNQPNYVGKILEAKRFDESGLLSETLSARKMWQYPEKREVYFEGPVLQAYTKGVLSYKTSGDMAVYDLDKKTIVFTQNVVFFKPKNDQDPEARLQTQELLVDLNEQKVSSKVALKALYGNSSVEADGFEYWQKQSLLKLHSRVHLIYEP